MKSYEYQVGGSLPVGAPTYVTRQADEDLYQALKENHYCHVLNCRQMGKSSLGVEIWQRLKNEGIVCAFITISEIGGGTATSEQWYGGMVSNLTKAFDLGQKFDLRSWWQEHNFLPPAKRLSEFIEGILLKKVTQPIVIVLDEIDSVLGLDFSLDDFFALIRYFYNQRVINPEFKRLSFVFLGVATPSDLIQDPTKTPFNIGTRIDLQGFELSKVQPLLKGLKEKADAPQAVMKEILYWTGGQPFLTQKLCNIVSQNAFSITAGNEKYQIEKSVKTKIINNWETQDEPVHFKTIQERIVGDEKNNVNLLEIYRKILENQEIQANEIDPEILLKLRLSGLVVKQQDKVKVYNEIYKEIFNSKWIDNKLFKIRPYAQSMRAWYTSGCKDSSKLLRGKDFQEALEWTKDRSLSDRDYKYLDQSQKSKSNRILRNTMLLFTGVLIGTTGTGLWFYDKYVYCPIQKGIVGEKIGDVCFRFVISNTNNQLFISSTNYHLNQGIEYFKQGKYEPANKLFEQAVDGDRTDSVPQIYLNNAKARKKGNPLKLAVVVPIDDFEEAATSILRGVADAQTEFNEKGGHNDRLLEIVIANDGNHELVAERVAKDLANQEQILGVIGHHASESTIAALPIYQKKELPIISPTSSSSEIENEIFFRTVNSTKVASRLYANYIKHDLHLDEVVVFYDTEPENSYSKTLTNDFEDEFKKLGGQIVHKITLTDQQLDIKKEIQEAKRRAKVVILIPSVKTTSVAIAIARENAKLSPSQKLRLFGSSPLSTEKTIINGGNSVEGMILASLCLNKNSDYMEQAAKRWKPKTIDWRVATSYDATQAFIEAIRRSKEPTREEILKQLKTLTLPVEPTSGFGLKWDADHSNVNRGYCLFEIENGQFKEKPLSPPPSLPH